MGYRRRRRYGRKKRFRRAKKRLYRRFSGEHGKRFFKLKKYETITSNAGGVLEVKNSTTDPTNYQDWTSVANLFDMYRVHAIKVKFIPLTFNSTSITNTPMYVAADLDSPSQPLTSENVALQYENCKAMNMWRPWKYYTKVPKSTSLYNAGTPVTVHAGGYIDTAQAIPTGGIYGYGSGYSLSTTYGTIISTIYLSAIDRK